MPVNQTLLDQHLDSLRAAQGQPDWRDTTEKLARSYAFMEDLHIEEGLEAVVSTGYENADALNKARLLDGEPPRHWRFRVMNQLARLRRLMANTAPNDTATIQSVRREHQGMAGSLQWVASQDREPPMRYVPFAQSDLAQQAIKRGATDDNDPDESRLKLRQYQAQVIREHINLHFPPPSSGKPPAKLTDRETFLIGKDIWSVAEHMGTDDDANQATARAFHSMIENGQIDHQGKVDKSGRALVTLPDFWEQVSKAGFDEHMNKNVTPAMKSHLLLQDRLPVRDVLDAVTRTTKNVRLPSIEVAYHDPANTDLYAPRVLTKYNPEHTRIMVTGIDAMNDPVIATQWHPDTPNHVAVIRPGKGHAVTHLPESEDAEAHLKRIQDAAMELTPRVHPLRAQKKLDAIKQAWYDLPTDDPEELEDSLNHLVNDLKAVARYLPPPGLGNAEQEKVVADLVKLPLLMGRERHLIDLEFAPPSGMATIPTNQKPDQFVDRADNGDGTTDVLFRPSLAQTNDAPMDGHMIKDIPNDQVRSTIAKCAAENNWTLGVQPHGLPGVSVFAPPHGDNPNGSVFLGHWLNEEDRKATLYHKPIGLLYRNAKGDPLFSNEALGEPRRSPEDAELMKYATINLMHDEDTEVEYIHTAYDTASFDGDFLVELADDDDWPSCSGAQFAIPPELFQHASDKELKTAITQQVALSSARPDIRDEVLERMKAKTWSQALDEADHFMSIEPEPMPDELPGL